MTAAALERPASRDAVTELRELVARLRSGTGLAESAAPDGENPPVPASGRLDWLAVKFGLSDFDTDVLALCAAVELDGEAARLCAVVHGNAASRYPTFGLAHLLFEDGHPGSLTPDAPLRRWHLVEIGPGYTISDSPLRIDPTILSFVLGLPCADERLLGIVEPMQPVEGEEDAALAPSHARTADRLARLWLAAARTGSFPAVVLRGQDAFPKGAIVAAAAGQLKCSVIVVANDALPLPGGDLDRILLAIEREAHLNNAVVMLTIDEEVVTDAQERSPPANRTASALRLVDRLRAPVVVCVRSRWMSGSRRYVLIEVEDPSFDERRQAWHHALGSRAPQLERAIETLVADFRLRPSALRAVVTEAMEEVPAAAPIDAVRLAARLREGCRVHGRGRLELLAARVPTAGRAGHLVLPPAPGRMLDQLIAQMARRGQVGRYYEPETREGVTALFSGPSGTGKSLAACMVAETLGLDLYRVDLSSVVNKYIGETEKNLRQLFDAAEDGGAVLLFDEADALFGKRSEVKDSHDRYANVLVNYLLQRIEAYHGLAILTTNMPSAIDSAFGRRLAYVIAFPHPDQEARLAIWRRELPPAAPSEGLDLAALARLNVTGGHIRNIARNALFLAAHADQPLRMAHLLDAARTECAKIGRPVTAEEIRQWA